MLELMTNNCDANLDEPQRICDEFFVFVKLALLSINANSFPFFLSFYTYFYVHIVLEIRNLPESRALARSRLISRQGTLHLKIFLQIFGPTCPCAFMSTIVIKKCAERSHFLFNGGVFRFLCLHLLYCDASFGLATLASNPCFSILPIRIPK